MYFLTLLVMHTDPAVTFYMLFYPA